jgi:tetratricopeptide (TPR) repeat protein
MARRLNFASTSILWPGLPQLWIRGCWLGASTAIGFTILLNLCILTTWVWSEMFPRSIFGLLWLSFVAFWIVGCYFNTRFLRKLFYITSEENVPDTFHLAQVEYLKGNWFEAEGLLTKLLERNPGDAEAHLLLVSILKMTGHAEEAIEHLEYMTTLNGSRRWQLEISRELSFLKAITKQNAKSPENSGLDLTETFTKVATTTTTAKSIAA